VALKLIFTFSARTHNLQLAALFVHCCLTLHTHTTKPNSLQ